MHVLILGGTTEGRRLAELMHTARPRARVTSSLAGRVAGPRLPGGGAVRIGGFGGVEGLTAWLRDHGVDLLIDATHPFAETISFHAAEAAAAAHVPLLALRRPGWVPTEGDDWHEVASLEAAAAALPRLGRRVFLTTGRLGLSSFAGPGTEELWFLARSVDPPAQGTPLPARTHLLLERGPFTLEGEREVLRSHRIDVLVTKDSGGAATAPKLAAARERGIPVVVVRRPPVPDGVRVVAGPEEAVEAVAGGALGA
ncbi:cobalt-precorrin-6A reductase [Streptomyces reniochalinae]|uniref:Cobalt-precorrin-6A reductase n=1 Tax=Streptomyces reniochalinae TaxID=2250578 RepID=A0A367F330_9ACTN|nr:cobalt-precorrin-6A reductase [Streptomyces reniochalinae]RCG24205.1 cobalt-precorrin-6A reductase [Streptomyces reniochalinae]